MVSESTIKRLSYGLGKIINSGLTIEQVKKLDYKEYNKLTGANIGKNILANKKLTQEQKDKQIEESLKGSKRILDQIAIIERKDFILEKYFERAKIKNKNIQDSYRFEYDNIFITTTNIVDIDDKTLLKNSGVKYVSKLDSNKKYGVIEIEHENGKITFIKFTSKQDLENQLNIVKRLYGKIINIEFHGIKSRSQYISQQFVDILVDFNR